MNDFIYVGLISYDIKTEKTRFNLLYSSKENFYIIKSVFNISGTNCAPPSSGSKKYLTINSQLI